MSSEAHRIAALRCADQDRELVAQVLNNAYAEGRLTLDEHAERIAHAYEAKTFGDLEILTTDLVPKRRASSAAPGATLQPVVEDTTAVAAPGQFTGGTAVLSTLKPGRIDVLAADVTLNAWLGEVRLDLVGATFASRDTTIHIGGLLCELRIRVPEGVDVNVSGTSMVMSDTKVEGTLPRPDGIRINLVGTLFMGEVKVLGPEARANKYKKFVK